MFRLLIGLPLLMLNTAAIAATTILECDRLVDVENGKTVKATLVLRPR